ncbi:aromatic amino acid hydroxylase [Acidiluteibacter ferrifornacis]|uniref:Aromatic amino acid hydroxylase n=1 Tax=Acidiluteibacter ferrifornacis TaxID=2692424 RepID=A0A6N9NQM1_9FLAO|nr:aromatic amino acid hydroxylase [Acidiluteibacter ferrifornacis]NBG66705.1 aromatic amino acid hydroxylase [Acidiluteibacter ferrifornacis]
MESNPLIDRLPSHLKQFIVEQSSADYTAQDQAVWRYVMRQNVNYLSKVAHGSYLEGLAKTGIDIEEIPEMYGMNRILKEIGWAAVAVDGFIPPSAFMEFQAYKVLVIAADIRTIDHIEYTPAPDIIHESAGHAPIIADPQYAEYLRFFGEIGAKAMSSAKDYELYEAIRHLSIIKENPNTKEEDIVKAEKWVDEISANMGEPSEMSRIRNLHWWTVEYGLIGTLEDPKIYGAGLLSSIGESYSCMQDDVKKIPYSIAAADQAFDITKPQPQLYVTPSFNTLTRVLNEFADTMALRRGGAYGLKLAVESKAVATAEYSSGLQICGVFTDYITDENEELAYVQTTGPTMLAYYDQALVGHGKDAHGDGFGSPVGMLLGYTKPIEKMSYAELKEKGIETGRTIKMEFESGVKIEGYLYLLRKNRYGNVILMTLKECTVTYGDRILFSPDWGLYDMAVGAQIKSVFNGPSDAEAFKLEFKVPEEKTQKIIFNDKEKKLHALYRKVRQIREDVFSEEALLEIWSILKKDYFNEWLLPLEIAELLSKEKSSPEVVDEITRHLYQLSDKRPEIATLINNGLNAYLNQTPTKV